MVKSDRMSRIMQSFILLGSSKNQEDYLDSFQKEHAVAGYLVLEYLETFKIADARTLQKTLSLKLRDNEERMVIIAHPTMDAQNAILKTLEELPEKNFVFFLVKTREDVLPTIASRSSFILLEQERIISDAGLQKQIREAENPFTLIDSLGIALENEQIELVLLSLRHVLLDAISRNTKEVSILFSSLKKLHENYKLTKTNNINKRMALDSALLTRAIKI